MTTRNKTSFSYEVSNGDSRVSTKALISRLQREAKLHDNIGIVVLFDLLTEVANGETGTVRLK